LPNSYYVTSLLLPPASMSVEARDIASILLARPIPPLKPSAQSDDGNLTSNYLHAQLHRREGDYWNSKWWLGTGMQSAHPGT
ncbi:hypothetical protein IW261DRAFT_1438353, partial [Armillaria novae-zelandiae]